MYCRNCGQELNENDRVCPACGTPVDNVKDEQRYSSDGWGFLGCCFPLVGLILFLVWKDNKPRSAKSAGIGAIIGLVLFIAFTALLFALGIGVGIFGLAEGMANGEIDLSEIEDYLEQNTSTIVNTLNL